MATTVTDDRTLIHTMDSVTGVLTHTALGGNVSAEAIDGIRAQGTNSIAARVNGLGQAGLVVARTGGAISMRDSHIFAWGFTLQTYATDALNGVLIGWGSNAAGSASVGMITAGGLDTNIGNKNNFNSWVIDVARPFTANIGAGLNPHTTNLEFIIFNWDFTSSNGRISAFVDRLMFGDGQTITAGTSGTPGNSDDIAANDDTNGIGLFQDIGGVFYLLGRITIGDITNAVSHFTDLGKVWNFQEQHVSGAFHKIEFVGHLTPINAATFGTKTGTGITASGSGGNTFNAGGAVPFRVEAIDANITVGMYGCQMVNAPAFYADFMRRVVTVDTPALPVDDTFDAISTNQGDILVFPAVPVSGDYIAFGHAERFDELIIKLDTGNIGVGAYTVTWEYSTGAATWAALDEVSDATGDFKNIVAAGVVSYRAPGDLWVKSTLVTPSMYMIRAVHDGGASTTEPLLSEVKCNFSGGLLAEQANFEAINGTWTNMGMISVRNNAVLKKLTLVNAVGNALSAQIDLGATDPDNNVRDITLIGHDRGVMLRPAGIGVTTYNMRNWRYFGGTFDVVNAGKATLADSYGFANNQGAAQLDNTNDGVGQSFTGNGGILSRCAFWVVKNGAPTGSATARLYAHSGVFGTSSIPTGIALASSEPVLASSFGTVVDNTARFVFKFFSRFTLVDTVKYVIVLEYLEGTVGNRLSLRHDSTAPTHGGNESTANDNLVTWTSNANDLLFEVFTGAIALINILDGGAVPTVETINGVTIINNSVPVIVQGMTEGTPVKIIANETIGTIVKGDILQESFADNTGATLLNLNYQTEFSPSGLDVLVRARNHGVATAAIANDGGVFTDETLAGSTNSAADMTLLPAVPVVGDAYQFGHDEQFSRLKLDITTAIAGTGNVITWEFWNGQVWKPLRNVVDGTNGLTTVGENIVSWDILSAWATKTDNAQGPFFYVRLVLSATTTITTVPVGEKVTLDVSRYLPYSAERTILESVGLTDNATWAKDVVGKFTSLAQPAPVVEPPLFLEAVTQAFTTSGAWTRSHTLTAGIDRVLYVATFKTFGIAATATGTYDGNAMTLVTSVTGENNTEFALLEMVIPDADTGAKNIVVNWSTATLGGVIYFFVERGMANDGFNQQFVAAGTSASLSVTNVQPDALIVSFVNGHAVIRTWTGAGGETEVIDAVLVPQVGQDDTYAAYYRTVSTAAAQNMNDTISGAAAALTQLVVSIPGIT